MGRDDSEEREKEWRWGEREKEWRWGNREGMEVGKREIEVNFENNRSRISE